MLLWFKLYVIATKAVYGVIRKWRKYNLTIDCPIYRPSCQLDVWGITIPIHWETSSKFCRHKLDLKSLRSIRNINVNIKVQMISWWSELPNIFLYLLSIKKKMPHILRLQQQQQQKNYPTSTFGGNISFLSAFRRASFILCVNKKFRNAFQVLGNIILPLYNKLWRYLYSKLAIQLTNRGGIKSSFFNNINMLHWRIQMVVNGVAITSLKFFKKIEKNVLKQGKNSRKGM